ncbi:hypothetical protein K0A97_02740 [Patescibacteria group bacterium]|nr:hypothetical protein [Patescibacteria group bacterium]
MEKKIKKSSKTSVKKEKKTKKGPINAPDESCFWVCNGAVLKNLKDLATALEGMSEEDYAFHANPEKNDFSAWVREILKDSALATSLIKAKSKKDAVKAVKAKLKRL